MHFQPVMFAALGELEKEGKKDVKRPSCLLFLCASTQPSLLSPTHLPLQLRFLCFVVVVGDPQHGKQLLCVGRQSDERRRASRGSRRFLAKTPTVGVPS